MAAQDPFSTPCAVRIKTLERREILAFLFLLFEEFKNIISLPKKHGLR